ncbi:MULTISPECIES: hypothetical protein [Streptomyces]|uniref:hypothetical protein n=1 Tax=Streptomyces TaxID=1883 RepID=UPI00168583EB|nr:hypothetical protein [Streptomyces venezuelae]
MTDVESRSVTKLAPTEDEKRRNAALERGETVLSEYEATVGWDALLLGARRLQRRSRDR